MKLEKQDWQMIKIKPKSIKKSNKQKMCIRDSKTCVAIRKYKQALGYSENWMTEYVYNIVLRCV